MPLVIPIFIPHEGCPHHCLFCDQVTISGQAADPLPPKRVEETIRGWLVRCREDRRRRVEVAFYGGTFTALAPARQRELLAAVAPFLDQGLVHSLRLSTRPDDIDDERLDLLVRHRVSIIELGAQSLDDDVLHHAGRGHDAAAVVRAAGLVRARDLRLGIQLMLGLPGDTSRRLRRTVERVIALGPDFVRLYPLLVLAESGLARLYRQGGYSPLSLGRAVVLAARVKKRFDGAAIPLVRMGLQPSRELEQALVAGPYHPAFGELVLARQMFRRTRQTLAAVPFSEPVDLCINPRDQSIFNGPGGANLARLRQLGLAGRFRLRFDPDQPRQTLRLASECAGHP